MRDIIKNGSNLPEQDGFNDLRQHAHRDKAQNTCVHQLFEAQAAHIPENVALICEEKSITYRKLNAQANRLAYYLRYLGVNSEVPVGICLERSFEMIIGILAVLKAGGAYIPLDPTYPQERLAFMLQDARISFVLTRQELVKLLDRSTVPCAFVTIDQLMSLQYSDTHPATGVTDKSSAYIIYTSGSTGQPKGVVVQQNHLLHSTLARMDYYQQAPASFLLLSSFAFDSSVAGIFWTLCSGGALVLPQPHAERDPLHIIDLIEREYISHLLCLPSLYRLLLEQSKPQQLRSLHTVIVAGEACQYNLVKMHLEMYPSTQFFNEYGVTEGSVWSSVYFASSDRMTSHVPIGHPISNTQLYVLDQFLQPVPANSAGELFIGGSGVARGYLQRAELTAARFIPDPFSNDPGRRLYKTGDVARYLPDGNIEYLGRLDQQVKIRGVRIEPGETEAALRLYPDVQDCVVSTHKDITGIHILVAYLIPKQDTTLIVSDIRQFLQGKLPIHLIPSSFILLENVPLLPNGKTNYYALPPPEHGLAETNLEQLTPTEGQLLTIWKDVLGLKEIGLDDNFFEIGGHSLLATRLISRIRTTFCVMFPLQHLFESATIAELAKSIEILQRANTNARH